MNDTPNRPAAPPTPSADKATETASSANEGTRPPPGPGSGTPGTVPSNHPDGPHPAVNGIQRIGEYTVIRLLGEGGMGSVCLAEDVRLRRKVAIKTMKPHVAVSAPDRERFEREARAAAAVEHDNIVPILHVGEAVDGTPFIVMPFLRGETLDTRLKRELIADLDIILKVAREVADGLVAAHAAGLIHRDIKPGNIWLEGDLSSKEMAQQIRRCKILDFGLARSAIGGDAQLTNSGAVLGTPAYMAPEQARGIKVDHRADLFSLGATLYRAATGKLPFNGPDPMAVLIALTTEAPVPIRTLAPNLPPAIVDLIDRLMTKDPAGRPQSAAEVSATVREIERDLQGQVPSRTVPVQVVPVQEPPVHAAPLVDLTPSMPKILPPEEESTANDAPELHESQHADDPKFMRFLWVFASVGAMLVLVPPGLWLAGIFGGKKPENPETNVVQEDRPKQVLPARDPKQPETPKKDNSPVSFHNDREIAEWVISKKGDVCVNGDEKNLINDKQELPKGPFTLTHLRIYDQPLTDEECAICKDCKHLIKLDLSGTQIGDAGLRYFIACNQLEKLELRKTKVSDKGAETIKKFTRLIDLDLRGTQVGRSGVIYLAKELPNCTIDWNGPRIVPWDP